MGKLGEIFGDDGYSIPDNTDEGDFELIPPGWYSVEIKKIEMKDTKDGTGKYLKVEFAIIGEHYTGRRIWNNYNLINKSEKAQSIGQRDFGRLAKACGYSENDRVKDEDEMLGMQLDIRLKVDKGKDGYDDKNIADSYSKLGTGGEQNAPSAPAPKLAATETPAAAANVAPAKPAPAPAQNTERTKLPWQKK